MGLCLSKPSAVPTHTPSRTNQADQTDQSNKKKEALSDDSSGRLSPYVYQPGIDDYWDNPNSPVNVFQESMADYTDYGY